MKKVRGYDSRGRGFPDIGDGPYGGRGCPRLGDKIDGEHFGGSPGLKSSGIPGDSGIPVPGGATLLPTKPIYSTKNSHTFILPKFYE